MELLDRRTYYRAFLKDETGVATLAERLGAGDRQLIAREARPHG